MKRSVWPFLAAVIFSIVASCLLFPVKSFSGDASSDNEWKAPARAAKKQNPIPADANSIAAGKVVYTKECFSCHGATGKGDGPAAAALEKSPGNLSDPKMWEQTDGALFWKITTGRKPMASYENLLTEEQRWYVINYVRTLAPRIGEKISEPNK
jgi:mono/diheme cytochrome c family protein